MRPRAALLAFVALFAIWALWVLFSTPGEPPAQSQRHAVDLETGAPPVMRSDVPKPPPVDVEEPPPRDTRLTHAFRGEIYNVVLGEFEGMQWRLLRDQRGSPHITSIRHGKWPASEGLRETFRSHRLNREGRLLAIASPVAYAMSRPRLLDREYIDFGAFQFPPTGSLSIDLTLAEEFEPPDKLIEADGFGGYGFPSQPTIIVESVKRHPRFRLRNGYPDLSKSAWLGREMLSLSDLRPDAAGFQVEHIAVGAYQVSCVAVTAGRWSSGRDREAQGIYSMAGEKVVQIEPDLDHQLAVPMRPVTDWLDVELPRKFDAHWGEEWQMVARDLYGNRLAWTDYLPQDQPKRLHFAKPGSSVRLVAWNRRRAARDPVWVLYGVAFHEQFGETFKFSDPTTLARLSAWLPAEHAIARVVPAHFELTDAATTTSHRSFLEFDVHSPKPEINIFGLPRGEYVVRFYDMWNQILTSTTIESMNFSDARLNLAQGTTPR